MTAETSGIQTPDQRLRVYVSSVVDELASERARVWQAIVSLRLTPVMVELGARPHAARELYRAYIEQSDVFIGLYGDRYGWVDPAVGVASVEDEYNLCGDKPRLLYVRQPAPDRDPQMAALLQRIESEGRDSYRTFATPDELVDLIRDDLALLLSERFSTTAVASAPKGPPRRPLASPPAPTTPIIGRDRDHAAVSALLAEPDTRLVTLTGPGGIGKTRLAQELGTMLQDRYPGGVAYAQLVSVRSPDLVLPSIATAVGAKVERGQPALDAIAAQVTEPLLLIPDNLEQIEGAGAKVAELLSVTPFITVLATSRTALRVRGEHEYQLPVLDVGSEHDSVQAPSPAVELFVQRAGAARPGFELTADNVAAITEICRRLDGLPLAIELAAARVRLLPPDALLKRLGNRLDTLGTGPADLPERQRTLRATIDWSFGLLDASLAGVMAALAVFTEGWTLDGVSAVCQMDELAALEAMDDLDRHSLILTSDFAGEPRFRMLATVKEYALERLAVRPDAAEIEQRHSDFYMRLLERAYPGMLGRAQLEWGMVLLPEQGNLRAVLRRHLERGDINTACHAVRSVWPFWWMTDQLFEAKQWIDRALEQLDGTEPQARAELLWAAWATTLQVGDNDGAVVLMDQARAAVAEVDDPLLRGLTHLFTSYTVPIIGDLDGAFVASEAALAQFREIGEDFLTGLALSGLGTISQMRGEPAVARGYHEQAVAIGRRLSNHRLLGQALSSLGMCVLSEGDATRAREYIDESADVLLASGSAEAVTLALSGFALLAAAEGDVRRAAVARGAIEAIRRRIGIDVWPVVAGVEAAFVTQVREALGQAEYDAALEEGARLSLAEAIATARETAVPGGVAARR